MSVKRYKTAHAAELYYDCSIPLEIFAHICKFLEFADKVAFASTCKYTRRLIREKYLSLPIFVGRTYPTTRQINPLVGTVSITHPAPDIHMFFREYAPAIYRINVAAMVVIPAMPQLMIMSIVGRNITRIPEAPKLYQCVAENSAIADISTLAACRNLRMLQLAGSPVTDIAPLKHCTSLQLLTLPCSCAPTLSAISYLSHLRLLVIRDGNSGNAIITLPELPVSLVDVIIGNAIADCGRLARLVNLEHLQIKCHQATLSLNFVAVMPRLRVCDITGSTVTDVRGLAACKLLSVLRLHNVAPDVDLSVLNACARLVKINITGVCTPDIAFLLLNLCVFKMYASVSTSISGVQYSPALTTLDISGSWIAHLPGGTWSGNLQKLNIAETLIADISGLIVPKLRRIDISETQIADISVLAGCPDLQKIDMSASYVADIYPLAACQNIDTFTATSCKSIRDISALLQLPRLTTAVITDCKIANAAIIAAALSARGVMAYI